MYYTFIVYLQYLSLMFKNYTANRSLSLNNFIPETIKLQHPLSSSDWLLGNYLQYGLYRVNYDIVNWNLLISQLKSNHKVGRSFEILGIKFTHFYTLLCII